MCGIIYLMTQLEGVLPIDEPLVGIVLRRHGREVVRYFSEQDEEKAKKSDERQAVKSALDLAGVWSGLKWSNIENGLLKIRKCGRISSPLKL